MISLKSHSEIELMKKAGEVVAGALELIEKNIAPGVTTLELDRIAEEYIRKMGATPTFKGVCSGIPGAIEFPSSICASVNEEVVHGMPGSRQLKDGDIISIDIGAGLNGFHGDAARTFPVGTVTEEALKLIAVTKQSFFEGMRNAVKGNRICDISCAVQKYVEANGFSVVRDYVGHGIGRELWEAPQIPNYCSRERGPRLDIGMTICIEPMVNQGKYSVKLLDNKWTVVTSDGSLSAHYENSIAVTDAEPIILTKLS